MIKAVILARVSTARQEEEGLSLDNQLQTLRDYASKRGFDVVQEFRFSESADRKIRKKFLEMVDFVKGKKDIIVIIAYRVDRITRNYRDAVVMDELRLDYEKELHFVYDHLIINKNTVGRDIVDWDLKVFLAKQYLNRLKEDAVNSAQYKLKNHEWPQGAPYAYSNVTLDDKKKWIITEPFQSKVVLKMYEWYSSGNFSIREIRFKVKDVFNINFSIGYVDFILKNKFYCGTMVYGKGENKKEYSHNYDRIISPELFEKVQQVKAGYLKKHFKFAGLEYMYRGLIRCAICGCMLSPQKKKGKYVYYHCTQYKYKHNAEWIREEALTTQFKDYFKSIQMPQEALEDIVQSLREAHKDKSHFQRELFNNYQKEYEKYETMIENLYDDKLSGSITEPYYTKKRDEFRGKQNELQKKIAKLQLADEEYYITSDYLLDLASRASELFEGSEMQERRQIIRMALQNLRLDNGLLCYDELKPFDMIRFYAGQPIQLPDVSVLRTHFLETEEDYEPIFTNFNFA